MTEPETTYKGGHDAIVAPTSVGGTPSTDPHLIDYGVVDEVATIVLNSRHNRNALSSVMVRQLLAVFSEAAANKLVHVIVLTHTGGTFCAGADLTEAASAQHGTPQELAAARTTQMLTLLRAMIEHPKPIIARIDGHVRAGGMGIVAASDIAIASRASSFALTEVRLGVAPAMIALTVLKRMNSRSASEYLLTGSKFDADAAQENGLITRAVDQSNDALDTEVDRLAAALKLGAPQALAATKELLWHNTIASFADRGDTLAQLSADLFGTSQAIEGITAFFQKRSPNWTNVD